MQRYNYILLVLILILTACVERYFIDDNIEVSPKIVISGSLTDECKPQEIVVSSSSSTHWPIFYPYSGCTVYVEDSNGNSFDFEEDGIQTGHYFCTIDEQYLLVGNKFKLTVETPEGQHYESPFEEMLPCPEIDSVYYKVEQQPTADPDVNIDGLQFYIDFSASDYFGPYYRWTLDEAYEYHSFWPIKNYIDENSRYVENTVPDYSRFVCYKTNHRDDILTLSTRALTENKFNGAKLIFVDDHTQRLMYNYRLLVRQLSLSEEDYYYWEKLKKNNKSDAGLFTKQPAMIVGNMYNVNDSLETVLGNFTVSSVTTKEVLIRGVKELSFDDIPYCTPFFFKYTLTPLEPRPLYMFYTLDEMDNTWSLAWSAPECFDCTILGGVVEKPSYFDY